jgi:hypothetical protein
VAPLVATLHGAAGEPEAATTRQGLPPDRARHGRQTRRSTTGTHGGKRNRHPRGLIQCRALPVDPDRPRMVRPAYRKLSPRPTVRPTARTLTAATHVNPGDPAAVALQLGALDFKRPRCPRGRCGRLEGP